MENSTMGKVLVSVKIENVKDLHAAEFGQLDPREVRSIEVDDALIDTGATMLSMPQRYINQLGLDRIRTRRARTANGVADFGVYSLVQLTIQGRDCRVDVAEVSDDCPVLIGQIPLECLDFVVDLNGQRLIGNPDHGGEHMIDLF
jgi:predicted aspartyl protease